MKIVILDGDTMGSDMDFDCIEKLDSTVIYNNTQPSQLRERIEDADVLVTNKVLLTEKNLRFAKKLKLICLFAIGYNNIDIEYCKKNKILVRNVPGYILQSIIKA